MQYQRILLTWRARSMRESGSGCYKDWEIVIKSTNVTQIHELMKLISRSLAKFPSLVRMSRISLLVNSEATILPKISMRDHREHCVCPRIYPLCERHAHGGEVKYYQEIRFIPAIPSTFRLALSEELWRGHCCGIDRQTLGSNPPLRGLCHRFHDENSS